MLRDEQLRLTAFSIVGQCLFYHFADPVIRNLLSADEYSALDDRQTGAAHHRLFAGGHRTSSDQRALAHGAAR